MHSVVIGALKDISNACVQCDLDRPCRHCLHARTECTITAVPASTSVKNSKKARVRRQSIAQTPAPDNEELLRSSSRSQATEESGRFGIGWSPPTQSNISEGPAAASPTRSQSNRESSTLPGFDADSALAITRKV